MKETSNNKEVLGQRRSYSCCSRQAYLRCIGIPILLLFLYAISFSFNFENSIFYQTTNKSSTNDPRPALIEDDTCTECGNTKRNYTVLWYRMLTFLQKRRSARRRDFSTCRYNNCHMSFNKSLLNISDAVIMTAYSPIPKQFIKPVGQVWIYAAHESPVFEKNAKRRWKKLGKTGAFNWTMTYNVNTTDIHLPYGQIRRHNSPVKRDFLKIAKSKSKGAIIITSHCNTHSKRSEYLSELQNLTDVTILGACGTIWDCGKRTIHNHCFDILNDTYAFYLAFENALCDDYFTEKLFENFDYDILLVTRGGRNGQSSSMFPKGSVIGIDDFKNVTHLARYLNTLMSDKKLYARKLQQKSQFYAVNYEKVYQEALCDICYRLNHQDKFYNVIPNFMELFRPEKYCTTPSGSF